MQTAFARKILVLGKTTQKNSYNSNSNEFNFLQASSQVPRQSQQVIVGSECCLRMLPQVRWLMLEM